MVDFPNSLPFSQGIDIRNSSQALQCGVKNDQPNRFPWLLLPRDQDSTILTERSTTSKGSSQIISSGQIFFYDLHVILWETLISEIDWDWYIYTFHQQTNQQIASQKPGILNAHTINRNFLCNPNLNCIGFQWYLDFLTVFKFFSPSRRWRDVAFFKSFGKKKRYQQVWHQEHPEKSKVYVILDKALRNEMIHLPINKK